MQVSLDLIERKRNDEYDMYVRAENPPAWASLTGAKDDWAGITVASLANK